MIELNIFKQKFIICNHHMNRLLHLNHNKHELLNLLLHNMDLYYLRFPLFYYINLFMFSLVYINMPNQS